MSEAKIQITIGSIVFSGEGTSSWLEKQLEKVLQAAPGLLKLSGEPPENDDPTNKLDTKKHSGTLASFLLQKNATSNQVKRFLATAEWLHLKGKTRIATRDVTKALSDNNQTRLGNPADCLNKNVSKGHCEKEGDLF